MLSAQPLMKLLRAPRGQASGLAVALAAVAAPDPGAGKPSRRAARCSARSQSESSQLKHRGMAIEASACSSPLASDGSGTHGVVEYALSLVTHLPLPTHWQ
jgi:hypothetical protein